MGVDSVEGDSFANTVAWDGSLTFFNLTETHSKADDIAVLYFVD